MTFFRTNLGRLCAATAVSQFGSMMGALSLMAILYLDATPTQMGILTACTTAPAILVAPFAGVWVDRLPHRSILLFADYGRFALLMTVPVMALADRLAMPDLYGIAFASGCLEIAFNLAYRAILPTLVDSQALVTANAKLRAVEAVPESMAPTLGGGIVQTLGTPVAVTCDAVTFLLSAIVLKDLPSTRSAPTRAGTLWHEASAGMSTSLRDARLRAILGLSATYGFFGSFLITLFALRVLSDLDLPPIALGLLAVGSGAGSLAGTRIVSRITGFAGLGRSILIAYLLAVGADLTIPLAGGPPWLAFAVLFGGGVLSNAFYVIENVASLSLRQSITPQELQGRVNAVFLIFNRTLRPAGALVAGFLGEIEGLQAALLIGVIGMFAAALWLILSPLRMGSAADAPQLPR